MATTSKLAAPELAGIEVHGMTRSAFIVRGALAAGAVYGAGVVAPFVSEAVAQTGGGDIDIVNFALTLEYLETDFYAKALKLGLSGEVKKLATLIHDDEAQHVDALTATVKKLAGQILLGLLDLSSMVELHRLPELFCGLDRRAGEGPTLYPVACSPQAWAAAAPFLILQASLGISIDAEHEQIVFDHPYLPEGIPQLAIDGLRCGNVCRIHG